MSDLEDYESDIEVPDDDSDKEEKKVHNKKNNTV